MVSLSLFPFFPVEKVLLDLEETLADAAYFV